MKIFKFLRFIHFIFILLWPTLCFSTELIKKEMLSGSFSREYFVHVPSNYRKDLAAPVVLVFHGGGGNARQIAKFSGFNDLSEKHGFLVIYPQAIDKHWNDGRESEKFQEHDAKINDVAWIEELIGELKRTYPVDKKRMYATEISNGGIFSQRLAIELGQYFGAIASLTAQIAKPLAEAKPKNPMSVLIINGTNDPFVPYKGGNVTPRLFPRLSTMMKQPSRGKVISTDATIEFWLRNNEIGTTGKIAKLPDIDKTDGATVEQTEWTNKNSGVSVMLYKIIGGGHTWPGARQYLPVRTVGQTCQDINASEKIWEFFLKHPKNGLQKEMGSK